jgi:hypothetical protein
MLQLEVHLDWHKLIIEPVAFRFWQNSRQRLVQELSWAKETDDQMARRPMMVSARTRCKRIIMSPLRSFRPRPED